MPMALAASRALPPPMAIRNSAPKFLVKSAPLCMVMVLGLGSTSLKVACLMPFWFRICCVWFSRPLFIT